MVPPDSPEHGGPMTANRPSIWHYSMNNPYLTRLQKAEVEAVYQFALGAFGYGFASFSLTMHQSLLSALGDAALLSAVAWLVSKEMMGSKAFRTAGFFFAGIFATVAQLALAGYAAFVGEYVVAAVLCLCAFNLHALVTPPLWLWAIFYSGGLHPKYRIAKRLYGLEFPFERPAPEEASS